MTLNRLVLWRHGETDYNATGRWQGHLDSALTETGWNQARFAVPVLTGFAPELSLIHATVFTDAVGIPLRIDERLRETNLGKWQGLTSEEVEVEWPGSIDQWRADPTVAPPDGESRIEVADRAAEVVAEVDREFSGTVMLCAHGGLITALTGRPGGDGRWRLSSYNAGTTR